MLMLGAAAALLAETAEDINHDYGSLVFIGVFFLALIAVGIWWLRR